MAEMHRLVKDGLVLYQEQREKSSLLLEALINTFNKRTFYSSKNLKGALGSLVGPSTVSHNIDEEIFTQCENLNRCRLSVQCSILNLLKILQTIRDSNAHSCSVDTDFFAELVRKIRQQTTLEDIVCSRLLEMNVLEMDQDVLVTMLSCFKFPPYVKMQEIDVFIDRK